MKDARIQPLVADRFFGRVQIDLVDFRRKPDGLFMWVFSLKDHFTKVPSILLCFISSDCFLLLQFCILRAMQSKSAAEVAMHLHSIFRLFGAPLILQSDNGREFIADVVHQLLLLWPGLQFVHGRPRNPHVQGLVEQSNGTLETVHARTHARTHARPSPPLHHHPTHHRGSSSG